MFLSYLNYRPLSFLVSILLLFSPNAATAGYGSVKIAQQPQTVLSDIKAVADKAFAEAKKLLQQGTAESLKQAISKYEEALKLYRQSGEKSLEATTLSNIGAVYSDLGEKQKALDFLNQALPLSRAVGNQEREAITLNNIGAVYSDLGEKQKALDFLNQALPLSRAVGDRGGEANTLRNIGRVYDDLGQKQKAFDFYNQVLSIRQAVGDKRGEGISLHNIGAIYSDLGEKQKALDFFNQALLILRAVEDRQWQANTLTSFGSVYSDLGEKQKALDFYNQALPLYRAVGDRRGQATILNIIGAVYDDLGEKQKALAYYNQALPILRAVGDRKWEARTLYNFGKVYFSLGEMQKALAYYNQALPILRAVGDRKWEARTLYNFGKVYFSLGEKQKALAYYNQALPLSRAVGDRGAEANTLYNFAYFQQSQGNLNEALKQISLAINIIEYLRTKIANQNLRSSYFATVQDYYKFYIYLLMELHKKQPSKGYNAIALQASESAHARSLLELIVEANTDLRTGVDVKLLQAERNIQQQLNNNEERRVQLLSGKYTPEQKQVLETEIKIFLGQYQDIQTQIRSNSPRYAAVTQPQPLTLAQIQKQVLDENTLLLEYSLGENKSYLWAITKTGMTSYELPKNTELEKLVKNFRNEIFKPTSNKKAVATAADALTKILIEPVATQLGNKRLVIVGDGALQYLPFTALTTPHSQEYEPLIINHEIVTLPSASTIALIRTEKKERKPARKSLAILADPVFTKDDQRLISQSSPTKSNPENLNNLALKRAVDNTDIKFKRLPFTRTEAENILKIVPANQSLYAYDFAANLDFVTNPKLSQYRILHFATHGILNSKQPELSGLVLSLFNQQGQAKNGFLRLHDVFNLNLSAELVVLSACQTGLGEQVKGEGLVGLSTGFIYAGSPRIVMSLWNVNDQATAILMEKFYQKMLKGGLKPAAALRQAQIEMFKDEQFSKPDDWAAFTLQGEWR